MNYQGQLSGPLGSRQTDARKAREAASHNDWTQRQNASSMYAKQQDQQYCGELQRLINEYIRYYGNDEDIQKIQNMNPNNWSCQERLDEINKLLNTKMGGKIRRHKKKSNRRTKKSRRRQRKQTRKQTRRR